MGIFGAASSVAVAAQLTLTWTDNSDNETGFKIERAAADGDFEQVAVVEADVTTYTDDGLEADTEYTYRVAAYNDYGDSDYSNTATATTEGSILASNTAPTITTIADRTIGEGGSTGAIGFVVGDAESEAADLTVQAVSSNSTVVPGSGIALGGADSSRTITITPTSGQTGTVLVTVTVSDGALETSTSFSVVVESGSVALEITTAPTSTTTWLGGSSTLSVVATGSTLTYQWYVGESGDTSQPIEGATSSEYTTSALSTATSYWVRVSSNGESVDSETVVVSISPYDRVYFGTFAGSGGFGLVVQSDGTAVMVADVPGSDLDLEAAEFTVDEDGAFSVEVDGLGTVSGAISGATMTGTLSGLGLSFSGTLDNLTGVTGALSGVYEGVLVNTADDMFIVVAGTNGTAFVLSAGAGISTSFDAGGVLEATLDDGSAFSVDLAATSGTVMQGVLATSTDEYEIRGWRWGDDATTPLVNASVRAQMHEGESGMIAGFIISGTGTKRVLLRGVGPTLADFGVTDAAEDPIVVVYQQGDTNTLFAQNDDWGLDENAALTEATTSAIGAFTLSTGSHDAAMVLDLPAGAYTAHVRGATTDSGTAIVEVYDADESASLESTARLTNISMRNRVDSGSDVLITGFIVDGDRPKRLLIRAVGPELADFGVSEALDDPQITLYESTDGASVALTTNDDWNALAEVTSAVTAEIGAFALTEGSKSAAIVIWLAPGTYTAVVRGASGSEGVVLTELYEVP